VTVTRDVVYTIPMQPEVDVEKLDIYAPIIQKTWPVVIFAHGFAEHKEDYRRFSQATAEQGFVVFNIEWPDRNAGARDNNKGFRRTFETFACAVRFARGNAATYGGDAARMTLMGFSAGASASALLAFAADKPERLWEEFAATQNGPPRQLQCVVPTGSVQVNAFVGIAGPYNLAASLQKDNPQLWPLVSPYAYLDNPKGLRVRLLHGTFDSTVPLEQSTQFHDALTKAGYDTQLSKFDKGHAVPPELAIEEMRKLWQ
jgi:predicted esterase